MAQGYRPLVADQILQVAPDSPHVFEPWAPLELTPTVGYVERAMTDE
jgi:hypothetical protein